MSMPYGNNNRLSRFGGLNDLKMLVITNYYWSIICKNDLSIMNTQNTTSNIKLSLYLFKTIIKDYCS